MSYVDIVIIAIVALFAIIGLIKGVKKSLISFLGFTGAFFLALFLAKPIGEALLGIGFIKNLVLAKSGSLASIVFKLVSNMDPGTTVYNALYDPIKDVIAGYETVGLDVTQAMSVYYADLLFNVIVGIVFFILARLILCILTIFLKSLIRNQKPGFIGRLLGFVAGAARGAVMSCALLIILVPILSMGFFPFVDKIQPEIDKSQIAKPVLNIVKPMVDKATKIDNEYFMRIAVLSSFSEDDPNEEEPKDEEEKTTAAFDFNDACVNFVAEAKDFVTDVPALSFSHSVNGFAC